MAHVKKKLGKLCRIKVPNELFPSKRKSIKHYSRSYEVFNEASKLANHDVVFKLNFLFTMLILVMGPGIPEPEITHLNLTFFSIPDIPEPDI